MTLLELMRKHQTDKAKHRFDVPFSFFFDEHHRHQVRSVLELGVKKGASLRVWEESSRRQDERIARHMRVWGIALLLKGEQGPVLDFEPFLKRGIKLPI